MKGPEPKSSNAVPFAVRWGPAVLHWFLFLPVLLTWALDAGPEIVLGVGGTLMLVGYPTIAAMEARRAPLLVSPASYAFGLSTLNVGAGALVYAFRIAGGESSFAFAAAGFSAVSAASGYVLMLLSALMLHVGLCATAPRLVQSRAGASTIRSTPSVLPYLLLFSIGVLGSRYKQASGLLRSFQGLFDVGGLAALSAYAIKFRELQRPLRYWSIVGSGTAILFVAGLLSNSKGAAMNAFLPVLWLLVLSKGRRALSAVLLVPLVALYIGFVEPTISAYRLSGDREGRVSRQLLERAIDSRAEQPPGEKAVAMLERLFSVAPVAFIVNQVEQSGLLYGEGLQYVMVGWMPRFLWPDKPPMTQGSQFYAFTGGDAESGTSLGLTSVGELYWNFGIIGVVLGMGLIGVLFGWLWDIAGSDPSNDPLRMWLYVSLILAVPAQSEAGTTLITIYVYALFFGLLIALGKVARRAPVPTSMPPR